MKTARLVLTVVMILFIAGFANAEGNEIPICTNSSNQAYPAISGNKIVWMDGRNADIKPDIYLYDLVSDTETRLTDEATDEFYAAIHSGLCVPGDVGARRTGMITNEHPISKTRRER